MTHQFIPIIYRVRYSDLCCSESFEDFWNYEAASEFFDSYLERKTYEVYLMEMEAQNSGRWEFKRMLRKHTLLDVLKENTENQ